VEDSEDVEEEEEEMFDSTMGGAASRGLEDSMVAACASISSKLSCLTALIE